MFNYIKDFNKHMKAFLATKFFEYSQAAFFKFLINIYFWRVTNDISFLVLYNIIFEITHGITHLASGKISKESNRFIPLRFGLAFQLVFLGSILFLRESIVEFIIPVAIVGGIAHGTYWSSDNLLKFDLTSPRNRFKFTAVFHILKRLAHGIIPLIASIIVVSNGDVFSSYSTIFVAALIFTALALTSTFFISKKKKFATKKYKPFKVAKEVFRDKNLRIACFSTFLSSIASILPILLGLMLFFSSGTELSIGGYQFITVGIAVIANYLVGKYFSCKDYKKLLIYGGTMNFLLIFILFIRQDFVSILIYGVLTSFFSVANNPFFPMSQDALNAHAKSKKQLLDIRVEYVSIHELFDVFGKVIGLLIILLLHYSLSFKVIAIAATLLALAKLLSNIYICKIKNGKCVDIDGLN